MTAFPVSDHAVVASDDHVLRAAVAAYLGRYRGESRVHTGSDLRVFLTWCAAEDLESLSLSLGRAEIERYVRWLQEVRRYQPSTVSRRLSVVVGFYRVCVIDQILAHSPADYVRRPPMPTDSPTLGLGHLQFEALLTTARLSTNRNDFAVIAMLGLLGLRIFEACGANITDLGEEHGHRVLKVRGKGDKTVLIPLPPAVARAIDHAHRRPTTGADPAQHRWPADGPARRDPTAAAAVCDGGNPDATDAPAYAASYLRHDHAGRRNQSPRRTDRGRHADPKTTMRYSQARKNLDRHPNYILAAYMASGT
jgi:integrase/recombinase XerD